MARPSKLTPATEKVILDALRAGATRTAAFEAAGIHRARISGYLRRFVTFRDAVMEAEAAAQLVAVNRIRQAIDAGGWRAAAWWLERRHAAEWGRSERIELITEIRDWARSVGEDESAAVAEAERWLREQRRAGS